MTEGDLVEEVIRLGLQEDLLKILEGSSKYFDEMLLLDLDRHSRRLRSMALMHMQFMVKFGYSGAEERHIKVGKIIHSNFPDYFSAWKLAGTPGVSPTLLENMIRDLKPEWKKI